MFEAALSTIQPNFPPGILQSDPKHSNTYFNLSKGMKASGPWNEGISTQLKEEWQVIDNPIEHVNETNGLTEREPTGTPRTEKTVATNNKKLAKERSTEVKSAVPPGESQWSQFPEGDQPSKRVQAITEQEKTKRSDKKKKKKKK